jgi:hypothetical protein
MKRIGQGRFAGRGTSSNVIEHAHPYGSLVDHESALRINSNIQGSSTIVVPGAAMHAMSAG